MSFLDEEAIQKYTERFLEIAKQSAQTKEGIGFLAFLFGIGLKISGVDLQFDLLRGKIVVPFQEFFTKDKKGILRDSEGYERDEQNGKRIIGRDARNQPVYAGSIAGALRE